MNNINDIPNHFRNSSHDPLNDIDTDVNILYNENAVTGKTNYVTIQLWAYCDFIIVY